MSLAVLHLLHDSRRSGVPAVASGLLNALKGRGTRAAALFAYDGIYARELAAGGVQVMTMGRRLPFIWRLNRFLLLLRLPWLVRRFDVIHAHSVKMAPAALAARLLGARVVLHLHEKGNPHSPLLRWAMATVDCVVFCAPTCAEQYAAVPVRRSQTILNAIPIPALAVAEWDQAPYRLVMLGSINRNKGQDLLLEAFSRLARKDVTLHLYGTVGLSAHGFVAGLRRFVTDHGLTDRVFFPGPTADAARVFREATILVHSSLNECLSISVLEAMSYRVPVIANRIPGMDEIITDGRNGFLVTPGDVAELAARIGQLLDDPQLRLQIGAAGRSNVEERFDMQQRVAEFAALYETLAAGDCQ